MGAGEEGNVKWVDGFRGVGAVLVVFHHISAAWFPYLLWSAPSPQEKPVLFQLPILRVLLQGRIGVAIFSLVTGYVCALKPIKLFQHGNHSRAYASMGRSAIRRVPRLVLPVTAIILFSGIATQLGAFETAKHCDGYGLIPTSPNRRATAYAALAAILRDMLRVWTHSWSEYGAELWTMMPILKGAFWVHVFLLGTAHADQKYRMIISLGLTFFRWASNDPFFGMQFFFGAFMADLQNLHPDTNTTILKKLQPTSIPRVLRAGISIFLLGAGLYISSLPDRFSEWQPWSIRLQTFLTTILPHNPDFPRFSSGLGLDLIVLSLHLCPLARTILSNRFFRHLGRISFAIYLVHNQILRSALCWMVYRGYSTLPAPGEPALRFPGPARLASVVPVYFVLVYVAANLWTRYVDRWCERVSEWLAGAVQAGDQGAGAGHGEKDGTARIPLRLPV